MRTCAQIGEFALPVEGNLLPLGNPLNEQFLVRLLHFAHQLQRFVLGQGEAFNAQVFADDLLHFLLKGTQLFRSEGDFRIKIVVEAVFNGRTDGQLCLGIQPFDRLSQNMGGCMAVDLSSFLVGEGQGRNGVALLKNRGKSHRFLADGSRQHLL